MESERNFLKNTQNKWVYAAGVFDLFHCGHIRFLEKAKKLGNVLVVGLVDDDAVKRYKFRNPIMNYLQRKEVLNAIKCIDFIVCQDDTDPTNTLKKLNEEYGWGFDVLARGDDYSGEPPGSNYIYSNGGIVVKIPYSYEISSTKIKEAIVRGSII